MHHPAAFSITLCIQSRLDQVRLVRAALSGVLNHLDVEQEDIHSLELAVTELVNNSFEHGYKGAEDQQLSVELDLTDADVEVRIRDSAPPFPEDQRYRLLDQPRSFVENEEEWTIRGHGLRIVRQLVDGIELTVGETGNCVTLKKRIRLRTE